MSRAAPGYTIVATNPPGASTTAAASLPPRQSEDYITYGDPDWSNCRGTECWADGSNFIDPLMAIWRLSVLSIALNEAMGTRVLTVPDTVTLFGTYAAFEIAVWMCKVLFWWCEMPYTSLIMKDGKRTGVFKPVHYYPRLGTATAAMVFSIIGLARLARFRADADLAQLTLFNDLAAYSYGTSVTFEQSWLRIQEFIVFFTALVFVAGLAACVKSMAQPDYAHPNYENRKTIKCYADDHGRMVCDR